VNPASAPGSWASFRDIHAAVTRGSWLLAFGLMLAFVQSAAAQEPAPTPPAETAPDPALVRARELYQRGVEHVKRQEWSEALRAFQDSARSNPHATTTFNVAACERALGNYTRARVQYQRALAEGRARPEQLGESLRAEAEAVTKQIEGLLSRVVVRLQPKEARISVDGRPLAKGESSSGRPVLYAGVERPNVGRPAPAAEFEIVMNPGAHVITISRKGFEDAVVNKSFAPGTSTELPITLSRLPATLRISSNVEGAVVRVDDVDIGPTPVDVLRPAGVHRIAVTKKGYDPFEADVALRAGELSSQRVTLRPESHPITKTWWFWTAAAAVVVGGVVTTYALTRPEPEPPPYERGNTGWLAQPAGARF
jgi:hypothetical protein